MNRTSASMGQFGEVDVCGGLQRHGLPGVNAELVCQQPPGLAAVAA